MIITLRRKTHKEQVAELLVRIAELQGEILKLKGENAELFFELKQLKKNKGAENDTRTGN